MAEIVHHGKDCSWRQSGNNTGHCSGCHVTFDGERSFDRHQTVKDGKVICHDPATMTRRDGSAMYESRTDDVATYWRLRPSDAQIASYARFLAGVSRDRAQ
jgi:hypothetical protein